MLLFTEMVFKAKETTFVILFSLLLLVSGLFFSCSNSTSNITVYQEVDTLRNYVQNKEIGVLWTKELDESALTKNIRTVKDISSSAVYSVDGVKAMKKSGKPIYPSLKGFTSLDITNLDAATIETVINFYDAVSENKAGKIHTFFDNNYIFNYVFFMSDLKAVWKEMTGSDYPDFYTDENESGAALFSTSYVGSPFVTEEYFQIPVRFISKKEVNKKESFYIDITLFISNDSNHFISNIEVMEWGKING